MPCLAETWEPLVLKAGYPFRQPKLVLAGTANSGACGAGPAEPSSYYCPGDETITMQWAPLIKYYKENPLTVIDMVDIAAHEYGHHVQMLTNILISSDSQEGWSKSKAAKLEWSRRLELQATCLSAAFISANKKSLGLQGQKLKYWEYGAKNTGDEFSKKKIRDHGSRQSVEYWSLRSFATADPASCNTYAAPSAKVT
jgi:predicted metalloprotease